VRRAPYDARDPAKAFRVAVSRDIGIPDEHERDVPRPVTHLEVCARVELGDNLLCGVIT